MSTSVPPPIFTLRGHSEGVTALTYCNYLDRPTLLSGDQNGSIILWDLSIFRQYRCYPSACRSKVQSLKTVRLRIDDEEQVILVAQSRNDGVWLIDLSSNELKILNSFPTFVSLFSKGTAINIADQQAVLAYPAYLENYLVTVRVLGSNAHTIISGSARRYKEEDSKKCPVFDISMKEDGGEMFMLLVAYEDSTICIFSFDLKTTETIPSLNSTGLKIDLVKVVSLGFGDFVSAFDIANRSDKTGHYLVCGGPMKELLFVDIPEVLSDNHQTQKVPLKKQGVSSIAIRPDCRLVSVSCWDSTIKLYSMKSRNFLATLEYHLQQVQDMVFVDKSEITNLVSVDQNIDKGRYLLCCASLDGTISVSSIY